MGSEHLSQLPITQAIGTTTRHHDNIQSYQFRLFGAKGFANLALDAISIHGATDMSLGYRQSQSGMRFVIGSSQHHQMRMIKAPGVGKYFPEFGWGQQPLVPSKTPGAHPRVPDQTARRLRPLARRALMT